LESKVKISRFWSAEAMTTSKILDILHCQAAAFAEDTSTFHLTPA
jgi:hypothetical protein